MAVAAEGLGYRELWVGEGPTWDAFVLATAVGSATRHASITVGPVAASVRDPATIARGAASVEAITGRPVGVAVGASSRRVVEKLHGRARSVTDLAASARALRQLMETRPSERHLGDPDADFLRRLPTPSGPLTVAAFGDRAVRVAAEHADRMLLDLVSPQQVEDIAAALRSVSAGRPPRLAAWLPAAVDPSPVALRRITESITGYLTVAGYREMFRAAGFDDAIQRARSGAAVDELVQRLPDGAAATVGLVGSVAQITDRLAEYAAAGLDEVAIVPATDGDPAAERTLAALSSLV